MAPASYTTYRVRGIPARLSKDDVKVLIEKALTERATSCDSGTHVEVLVKSLAIDLASPDESVATVSFKNSVETLLEPNEANEWDIDTSDEITLLFDTHFYGCTTLHCPPKEDWRCDLIAISGLNGHAFGSFKKKNGPYMWLRDDLPKKLPGIRVIVYGYDTKLEGSRSFQNISDIGMKFQSAIRVVRRPDPAKPLLLLGHSLGGIVIKEAIHMVRSSQKETDRMSFAAISGIMFFGVPNQGMDIKSLIPIVGDQVNRGFLHTLEHSSPMLRTQAAQFSKDTDKLQCDILNFFETQKSPTAERKEDGKWSMTGPPTVFVDAYSATHGRLNDAGSHQVYPVNRTHGDLVKFDNPHDETYTKFLDFLRSAKANPKAS
ncbi:putative nacht and ankyrin domain containing protein [Neofusicoccum parvum UCRNP2]|uniref:Putative nacht and ankyrin domain containing protein n=1 Tax=Botryosphaeria parva (strain UCR-NP2) TaxID=1287680 RepID=R1H063_BOTPV|nr:putative nacht and ankyrin domain containing protein [Neofusicoccum parvum UCRNP2]